MRRVALLLGLIALVVSAAYAQDVDDGACLVAPADIVVKTSLVDTVTWRSSGGAQIYDASVPVVDVDAQATANARVRRTPDSTGDNVFTVIPSGGEMQILGRDDAGGWLYIVAPDNDAEVATGWVSVQVASIGGGVSALPVVSTENPPFALRPFQAVTVPAETCSESEAAGVLVQATGRNFSEVIVNNVAIKLRGTVFVRPTEADVTVNLLAGKAIVANEHYLPPGAAVTVALADHADDTIAPYSDEVTAVLPLAEVFGSPFTAVEAAPALADDAIEAATLDLYAPNGLIDGFYRISVTSFTRTKPELYTDGYCFSGGTALNGVYVENGRAPTLGVAINILSMTSFSFENSYEDDYTGCKVSHYAVLAD